MESTTPTPEKNFYQCQKPTPVKKGPNGFLERKGITGPGRKPPSHDRFPPAAIAEVPIHDYQVTTGDVHNLEDHSDSERNIWQKKTVSSQKKKKGELVGA